MRFWTLAFVVAALSLAPHALAENRDEGTAAVCQLKITGMTCGGCEGAVKMAAKRIDGVKSVSASYRTGSAEVTYDPAKTSPDAIAKAVSEKSGFKAEVVKKKP